MDDREGDHEPPSVVNLTSENRRSTAANLSDGRFVAIPELSNNTIVIAGHLVLLGPVVSSILKDLRGVRNVYSIPRTSIHILLLDGLIAISLLAD